MRRIQLNLSRHCIQTEIRRLYHHSISECFSSSSGKEEIEENLEILKNALETLDFQSLRSKYPELSGHHEAEVHLMRDNHGRLDLVLNGEVLPPIETDREKTLKG